MPPMSVLIKPASSLCQMRCQYCFYASIANNRVQASYGIMPIDTLEELIQKALAHADGACSFAFQGGEPTMAGLDFFEAAVRFQRTYNVHGVSISNAIQTNGYAIDDKWAQFFHDQHFLVGLSMDGPKDLHDRYRIDANGKGTFQRAMAAARLFKKYKVEFNILHVITSQSARHPEQIYNFYKKQNLPFLQFISCLDPVGEARGGNPYSLTPRGWQDFYMALFDCWYRDFAAGQYVSVRYFDNLVHMLLGRSPEICALQGQCCCQWVIESDGGIYPCDFYVLDAWKMGNIHGDDFPGLMSSSVLRDFIQQSQHLSRDCASCRWFSLCRGGCRREREDFAAGTLERNHYCEASLKFLEYSYPRLLNVARSVRHTYKWKEE